MPAVADHLLRWRDAPLMFVTFVMSRIWPGQRVAYCASPPGDSSGKPIGFSSIILTTCSMEIARTNPA